MRQLGKYESVSVSAFVGVRDSRTSKEDIAILCESMEKIGILHAPVVTRDGARFRLVAGASRFAAAKKAGLDKIHCLVLPHGADSAEARLAFIDENILRTELTPAHRDEMWAARKKLLAQIDPSTTGEARKASGQKSGGKTGGRGRNSSTRSTGKPKSRQRVQRQQDEAAHRKESATQGVWEMYGDGRLSQSQVDEVVKAPKHKQTEIAQAVEGKSVAETKAAVRAVQKSETAPAKLVSKIAAALTAVSKNADQFHDSAQAAAKLLSDSGVLAAGFGTHALLVKLTVVKSATDQLAQLLMGQGKDSENGQRQLMP